MIKKELLDVLACPKCKGELVYANNELVCNSCKLAYRIEDDIPIMLVDDARKI